MDINKYGIAIVALALTIYILRNTSLLYGLSYYIVPSILSLLVYVVSRNYTDYLGINKIDPYPLYILVVFISVYYSLGLLFGFGINTVAIDLLTYSSYVLLSITQVISVESIRSVLANLWVSTSIKHRFSKVMLISLAMLLLVTPYTKLINFKLLYLPELLTNYSLSILLTTLFLKYGFKLTVIYHLLYLATTSLMPILPVPPWYLDKLLIPLFILIQLVIILATSIHSHAKPVKHFVEEKKIWLTRVFNIVFIAIVITLFTSMVSGYHFFVVVSGSMQPTINIGDIIVVENTDNITKGDIIAFIEARNIIVHRVVDTRNKDGKTLYSTKGDANTNLDPWLIENSNVVGKLKYIIPLIGYPIVFFIEGVGDYITSILFSITTILFLYIIYIVKNLV